MKLPIANCRLPIDCHLGRAASPLAADGAHGVTRPASIVNRKSQIENGFTMVEIAICLAIIGIALVAIIGVLPIGINTQKDNRQETLVNQDATVFLNAIRNGARGMNNLTNYVFAITNFWTFYNNAGVSNNSGVNSYTYTNFSYSTQYRTGSYLTNGANIIGLLSTPRYTDANNGAPLPNLNYGGISNHVVAYVRSLSGSAVAQPPQNNPTILGDTFSYKILCDNAPVAVYTPPLWQQGRSYNAGDVVFWPDNVNGVDWRAVTAGKPSLPPQSGDEPGVSDRWAADSYAQQLTANLHQLRLTFLWPLLPNGNTGPGRHTFATTVAGQVVTGAVNPYVTPYELLYFFQPQSFTAAP